MTFDDAIQGFMDAMAAAGCAISGTITPDGKLHRFDVVGLKKGAKHGWYVFHSNEPFSGAFGNYKTGVQQTWTAKSPQKMTAAERQALAERIEREKKQRAEDEARAQAEAAAKAEGIVAKGVKADPAHPYLAKKQITAPAGLRQTADGKLIVPLYDGDRKLWGVQLIAADGTKRFLTGQRKRGCYWSVGKPSGTDPIIIAEGFATAVSIHMATGFCVVIGFDRGNLKPVAITIRRKFPDRSIIIAGDDDRFTAGNPGKAAAEEAATEVHGATCIAYGFVEGSEGTDWNDVHCESGLEPVRIAFDRILNPDNYDAPEAPPPAAPEDYGSPDTPSPVPDNTSLNEPPPAGWAGPKALGFDDSNFYFLSARTHKVYAFPASGMSEKNLLSLAPMTYWEMEYPSKGGANWSQATDSLIGLCSSRGEFEPDRITGRGVTIDKGRTVLHLGNKLIVDGRLNEVGGRPSLVLEDSNLIYPTRQRIRLERCKPLDLDGCAEMLECIDLLPWSRSYMSRIFSGWLVMSMVCGILRWRPHVWITGPRGSGKSWVVTNVASKILGPLKFEVGGTQTTEAGIRQTVSHDALPVLFDESESQNDKSRERLQIILDLARQASSEDTPGIVKGGQNGKAIAFRVRAPFMFSSVNLGATQSADLSRIIVLSLEGDHPDATPDAKKERVEKFGYIERRFANLVASDFSSRLFGRALLNAKKIASNAKMFAQALAEGENRRLADTIAAPMAGWFSLISDEELTMERAREIVESETWTMDVAEQNRTQADHEQALDWLLVKTIRHSQGREDPVATLIVKAMDRVSPDVIGREVLASYGIRVEPESGKVVFAQGHDKFRELFASTPWAATAEGTLAMHPRAEKTGAKRFGPGVVKKGLAFRADAILASGPD